MSAPPLCKPVALAPVSESALAVAIARTVTPETALEPGRYRVRGTVTLAVNCVVSKGGPGTYRKAWAPEWPAILAALLTEVGVRWPGAAALLVERAAHAATHGPILCDTLDAVNAALGRVKEAYAATAPHCGRAGATTVNGSVEIVDWQER